MHVKKTNIVDIAMMQLIIIMLAFKDFNSLAQLSQLIAFSVVVLNEFVKRRGRFRKYVAQYAVYKALFIVWCALSAFWSVQPSVVSGQVQAIILRTITGITILLYVKDVNSRDKFLKYCVFAGIVLCVRLFVTVPLSAWGADRVGIYLAHNKANSYGYTGITYVLGVITVYLIVFENLLDKRIRYSLIVVFSIVSFLSGSKKLLIILVVTFLIYIIYKSKNVAYVLKNMMLFSALFAVCLCCIFYVQALYNVLGQRLLAFMSYFFSDVNASADLSTINRAVYLKLAMEWFKTKPLIGLGIDGFRYVNPQGCWAENNFVELLADLGIIGTVIYYLPPLYCISPVLKKMKKNERNMQITIIFVALMIIDYTMVTYGNTSLQFHLAFLFSLAHLCYTAQRKERVENECYL